MKIEIGSKLFFDREAIRRAVGRGVASALSKSGATVRTFARRGLKRRKRKSLPSQTPSIHSTHPVKTLKAIWFEFEPSRWGVVIGPRKFEAKGRSPVRSAAGATVPNVLEFAGDVIIDEKRVGAGWALAYRKAKPGQPTRRRRSRIGARPFMGPALADARTSIPENFRGCVRG